VIGRLQHLKKKAKTVFVSSTDGKTGRGLKRTSQIITINESNLLGD